MIFLILNLLFPYSNVAAQSSQASIGFEPKKIQVSLDATNEVAIIIQDVKDLYAFDILINYDPSFLEVIDANTESANIQISQGSFLESGLVVKNTVDDQAGTINFVTTQLSPSKAKSGSGNLVIIRLKGKKEGSTTLLVTDAQLSNRNGEQIPVTLASAKITISTKAVDASVPTPFDVVQPTVNISTEIVQPAEPTGTPTAFDLSGAEAPHAQPTKASTFTPTAEKASTKSESPQPQAIDFTQVFSSGNLLCFGSTILDLAIAIVLVIFLRKKLKQKRKKTNT